MKILAYATSETMARTLIPWVRLIARDFGAEVEAASQATLRTLMVDLEGCDGLTLGEARDGTGPIEEVIARQTEKGNHDLVLLAPAGRRGVTRLLKGSMVCNVVGRVSASVLVVREGDVPPRSILTCVSGSRHSLSNVRVASRLALAWDAEVRIMLVLSQVPIELKPSFGDGRPWGAHAAFLDSDHPLAGQLRASRDLMRSMGARGEVVIREGLVVEEILREMSGGGHGLLAIGTHLAEDFDPLYENVAAELIRRNRRSTLVVGIRASFA